MPTQAGKAYVPFEGDFSKLQQQAGQAVSHVGGLFSSGLGGVASMAESLARSASVAFVGVVAGAGLVAKHMIEAADRVDELNIVLGAVAKANNASLPALQAQVAAVKALGIETAVAQSTVVQFTRMQLNLADATKLARVAQDAAVISGQNSTDTLAQLTDGIQTMNVRVLRTAGININAADAEKVYAASLGIAVSAMTPAQKQQAILNAVIEQGTHIQGAYLAALESPGKQLRSMPRLFNDIAVNIGQNFTPAVGKVITGFYTFVKAIDAATLKGKPLGDFFAQLGTKASVAVGPIVALEAKATLFVQNLTSSQIQAGFDKVIGFLEKFGPAVAGVGAALGAAGASNLPFIGQLLPHINPLLAGVAALVMLNPQLRDAVATNLPKVADGLKAVFANLAPRLAELIPKLADLAVKVGTLLFNAIHDVLPLVVVFADVLIKALGWLADHPDVLMMVAAGFIAMKVGEGLGVMLGLIAGGLQAVGLAGAAAAAGEAAATLPLTVIAAGIAGVGLAAYSLFNYITSKPIDWTAWYNEHWVQTTKNDIDGLEAKWKEYAKVVKEQGAQAGINAVIGQTMSDLFTQGPQMAGAFGGVAGLIDAANQSLIHMDKNSAIVFQTFKDNPPKLAEFYKKWQQDNWDTAQTLVDLGYGGSGAFSSIMQAGAAAQVQSTRDALDMKASWEAAYGGKSAASDAAFAKAHPQEQALIDKANELAQAAGITDVNAFLDLLVKGGKPLDAIFGKLAGMSGEAGGIAPKIDGIPAALESANPRIAAAAAAIVRQMGKIDTSLDTTKGKVDSLWGVLGAISGWSPPATIPGGTWPSGGGGGAGSPITGTWASGGTIPARTGGWRITAGEGGQDEDIVPASERLAYAARQLAGRGGGPRNVAVTVNAQTNADPVEISRTAAWEIRRAIG